MSNNKSVLPIIIFAQFACTSLWFASNAVVGDLQTALQLAEGVIGHITAAVQFGFIAGTLVFAILTISDRFSPSSVFLVCAFAGAITNLGILLATGFWSLMLLRIATGFMLAGIYPVGMKIASDYYEKGLGKALGWLVGALVVGTGFPHLLKTLSGSFPWQSVVIGTSVIAVIGGLSIGLLVPDGPFRKPSSQPDFKAFFEVFKVPSFRAAAFGYFGHMWELYTFWAFVPVILLAYQEMHPSFTGDLSLWSFLIIAIGGISCGIGGIISLKIGSRKVAMTALFASGICCLLSPFLFQLPVVLFLILLLFWGMAVITDSPQFSTLVAQSAPKTNIGTALTIVNSIGFAITIVSIQLVNYLSQLIPIQFLFLILVAGPLLGLLSMRNYRQPK
jgi:predicted MFS family arabinose efflux permease